MIKVENVSMEYKIQKSKINSLKEYLVNVIKGKIVYETFCAVNGVNININKGEVVGIVGRNGAGKSTLLKIISGLIIPTEGKVQVNGTIAPMLELGAGFDAELTARENIFLNGAILGYDKKFLSDKYNEIVEFSELHDFMEQPVRTFSSGMIMRLAFSVATLVNPEILIVDEILAVGDGHFAEKSGKRMREIISGGTTVLMVSHDLSNIRNICSRVIWLEKGKVKMDGEANRVCDKYLESL